MQVLQFSRGSVPGFLSYIWLYLSAKREPFQFCLVKQRIFYGFPTESDGVKEHTELTRDMDSEAGLTLVDFRMNQQTFLLVAKYQLNFSLSATLHCLSFSSTYITQARITLRLRIRLISLYIESNEPLMILLHWQRITLHTTNLGCYL